MKNQYAYLTAKERTTPSLPARMLYERGLIQGRTLDFGCGFGKDVAFLKGKQIDIEGFDPYYFPDYPMGKFDTILCFYVLNVLFPEEQKQVLMEVSNLLKPTGKAYFVVRRDIYKDGFRTHHVHAKPTYQCAVQLPYQSIFLNENTEFYQYQHFTQITHKQANCAFCKPNQKLEILAETPLSYAIFDGYPITKGHSLVIPKRHVADYFDLDFEEQKDMMELTNFVYQQLKTKFQTNDFTIGINIGKNAGQKMPHTTLHLIPRYEGDCKNPSGGVRNILK